ncbi:MAG: hypothetical protein ACI35V_05775 [Sphingobacterium composti]|uniref:hypothetical protein n=1 Tax=Sphingobacterium composti TaxID=363260 RepID=UPI00135B9F85|nr:hypothetical protein [Sphingobacterium composti Ten et al. 2007 non Yoo et al. 2007]
MKTRNYFVIFLALFLLTNTAYSQIYRGRGIKYSVAAEVGQAVSYLAKKHDKMVGLSFQTDFPIIDDELFATVNFGFNNAFVRTNFSHLVDNMHIIPIKTGLKYYINKNVYAQTDIGISILLNKTNCVAGKTQAFVIAPQLGYLLYNNAKNSLDFGVRFESTGKFYQCDRQNNFVGFKVAWSFIR